MSRDQVLYSAYGLYRAVAARHGDGLSASLDESIHVYHDEGWDVKLRNSLDIHFI